ncbi:MAG: hypothetical protein WAM66_08465 [Acidobacteriaceae bacterium]
MWSLLVLWFLATLLAGYIGVFNTGPFSMSVPIPLGVAALLPILVFAIWFWSSSHFREFALSLNPVVLTAVHTWRIGGITFILLMAMGLLPAPFALPAGLGDFAIGVTAPFVAYALSRKALPSKAFVAWHYAGIADLVVAVTTGVLSSITGAEIVAAHGTTTRIMGLLPMSLIPTFAVPLLLILHIICLAQIRQIKRERIEPSGSPSLNLA